MTRRIQCAAAVAMWLGVPWLAMGQNGRTKAMQEELVKLIELGDAEYGKLDDGAVTGLSLKMAAFIGKRVARPTTVAEAQKTPVVLVLWAPKKVEEKDWRQWPLLVGQHTNGWRGWSVSWETNARLVITNLETGAVTSNRLGISDKKRYRTPAGSRSTAPPDDFDGATISTGVEMYRIFEEKEANEPAPRRFAVTVLDYDLKSNTVVTEVVKKTEPVEEAVERRVEETAEVRAGVTGGLEAGQIRATPKAVEVSVALTGAQGAAMAKGERSGAPVVAGAVLIVGLDADEPIMRSFWAPAKVDADLVKAAFTLDLGPLLADMPLAGEFQVYVAIGGVTLGPVAVDF